jgi:hypothetical protein
MTLCGCVKTKGKQPKKNDVLFKIDVVQFAALQNLSPTRSFFLQQPPFYLKDKKSFAVVRPKMSH